MAIFKCKICGGNIEIQEGGTICECGLCKTKQTVPSMDNEKNVNLFNRANRLRISGEFDKAAGVYKDIAEDFPEEAEAWWGLCLCKYGVEYADNADEKNILTCCRTLPDSIFDDSDFDLVLENAEGAARQFYREEAKRIDRVQKGSLETANKQEPFDVFICCRESGENGEPTEDSKLARDICDALAEKGHKVFWGALTLSDKAPGDREPYIFGALSSARVMLAIGTNYENYNDPWVKNEWSRFLTLAAKDSGKTLIPCCHGIDAYDMPKEFRQLKGIDLGSEGAIGELVGEVEKILSPSKAASGGNASASPAEPLIKRGMLCLEDEDWEGADNCYDKILDIDPENANAYVLKLCSELKIRYPSELSEQKDPLENNKNYKKAIRFGDDSLRAELEDYNDTILKNIENKRKDEIYNEAVNKYNSAVFPDDYKEVKELLMTIKGYKDADSLLDECSDADILKNSRAYYDGLKRVEAAKSIADYKEAREHFLSTGPFRGSDELINKCNKEIYAKCVQMINGSLTDPEVKDIVATLRYLHEDINSQELADHLEDGALDYYCKAKIAIRNDDFIRARDSLNYIKGFLDTDELIQCCKNVINQSADQTSPDYKRLRRFAGMSEESDLDYYNNAKEAIRNGDFPKARDLFKKIKSPKGFGTEELIQRCQNVIDQNCDPNSADYQKLVRFAGGEVKTAQSDNGHAAPAAQNDYPGVLVGSTMGYGQQPVPVPYGGAPGYAPQPAAEYYGMDAVEMQRQAKRRKTRNVIITLVIVLVLIIVGSVIAYNVVTKQRTEEFRNSYFRFYSRATVGQLINASITNPKWSAESWRPEDLNTRQPALACDGDFTTNGGTKFKVHLVLGKTENSDKVDFVVDMCTIDGDKLDSIGASILRDFMIENYESQKNKKNSQALALTSSSKRSSAPSSKPITPTADYTDLDKLSKTTLRTLVKNAANVTTGTYMSGFDYKGKYGTFHISVGGDLSEGYNLDYPPSSIWIPIEMIIPGKSSYTLSELEEIFGYVYVEYINDSMFPGYDVSVNGKYSISFLNGSGSVYNNDETSSPFNQCYINLANR